MARELTEHGARKTVRQQLIEWHSPTQAGLFDLGEQRSTHRDRQGHPLCGQLIHRTLLPRFGGEEVGTDIMRAGV
jgi:hypothetical protein